MFQPRMLVLCPRTQKKDKSYDPTKSQFLPECIPLSATGFYLFVFSIVKVDLVSQISDFKVPGY